jgi:hypothetical protein
MQNPTPCLLIIRTGARDFLMEPKTGGRALDLNGRPVDKAKVRVSVPAGESRGWSQPFYSRPVSASERWTATATVEPK